MDLSKIHRQSYLFPEELANSILPFDDSNVFSFPPLAAPRNKTSLLTPLSRLHPRNVFSNRNPYQPLNCTYPFKPNYDGRSGIPMWGHFPPLLRRPEYRNQEMFSKLNARKCDLSPKMPMNYVCPFSLNLGIRERCPKWRNGPSALMQHEYKNQCMVVKSSLEKTTIARNSNKPESQGDVLKLHPGETEYKSKWRNCPSALMQPEYKNQCMVVKSSLQKTTIVRNSNKPESQGDVVKLHPGETEYKSKWTCLAPSSSEIGAGNDQRKTDVNKLLKVPMCSNEKPASYANVLKLNNDYVEGQPETGNITVGMGDNKHRGEDWETRSSKSGDLDLECVILKPSYAEQLKLTIHSWKVRSECDSGETDGDHKCTASQENEQMDDATCNPNNPMTNADPIKLIPGAIGFKSTEGQHPSVSSKAAKRNKKRKTNAKKAKANAKKLAMIPTNTQDPSFDVLTLLNDSSELPTGSENSSVNSCDSDPWDDNCEAHGANLGEIDSEYSFETLLSSTERSKLSISAGELQSEYENIPVGSGEPNDGDHSCAAGKVDDEMDDATCNPNNPMANADPVTFTPGAKEFKPKHASSPLVSSKAKKNKRKTKSTTRAMDTTCKAVKPASSVAVLKLSNDYIEVRPESANITVGSVYTKHGNHKCEKQSPMSLEVDSECCPDKALSCADELHSEYENIPVSREIDSDLECAAGKINQQKIGDSLFNPDGQTCHSQPKQNPTTKNYKPVHNYTPENIEWCSEKELSEQDSLNLEHASSAAETSTDDSDPRQLSTVSSDFEFDDSLRTPEFPPLQEYTISQNQTPVRNNMAVLVQDKLANPAAEISIYYSDPEQLSAMSSDFEFDDSLRTPESPPLQEYTISQNQTPVRNMAVLMQDKLANPAAETSIYYSDPGQLSAMSSDFEFDDSLRTPPESPPLQEYLISQNQTPVRNNMALLVQDNLANLAAETSTDYSDPWQLSAMSSVFEFNYSLQHWNQALTPESFPLREYQMSYNQTPVWNTSPALMQDKLAAPAAETFAGYDQRQLPPASSDYFELYNSLGHTNQAMTPEYPLLEYQMTQNQTPVRSRMALLMENPPFIPWLPLVTPSMDHPVSTCWYVPHDGQSLPDDDHDDHDDHDDDDDDADDDDDDCYPNSIDSRTSLSASDSRTSLSASDSRTSLSSADSRTSLSTSDSRTSLSSSDSSPSAPEPDIASTDCFLSSADFYSPQLRMIESEIRSYFRSVRGLDTLSRGSQHDAGAKSTLLSLSHLISSSHLDPIVPCGVKI